MKYSELISGIFWLSLGILFSIWSTYYKVGSLTQPGPGFLPLVLGVLLIFISLILLGQAWKAYLAKKTESFSFLSAGWKKIVYTILILLFATFSFEKIGYLITVFLFIFFLMLQTEFRSPKKMLLTAFFTALGVYLIFILLLKQPFPRGFLRF